MDPNPRHFNFNMFPLCSVAPFLQPYAHSSLVYLVSLLGSMEHSFHHTLLLEIRALTDRYPSLLGGCGKDIYRMSNSFTAIARLLGRRLEENTVTHCRSGKTSEHGLTNSVFILIDIFLLYTHQKCPQLHSHTQKVILILYKLVTPTMGIQNCFSFRTKNIVIRDV